VINIEKGNFHAFPFSLSPYRLLVMVDFGGVQNGVSLLVLSS